MNFLAVKKDSLGESGFPRVYVSGNSDISDTRQMWESHLTKPYCEMHLVT